MNSLLLLRVSVCCCWFLMMAAMPVPFFSFFFHLHSHSFTFLLLFTVTFCAVFLLCFYSFSPFSIRKNTNHSSHAAAVVELFSIPWVFPHRFLFCLLCTFRTWFIHSINHCALSFQFHLPPSPSFSIAVLCVANAPSPPFLFSLSIFQNWKWSGG